MVIYYLHFRLRLSILHHGHLLYSDVLHRYVLIDYRLWECLDGLTWRTTASLVESTLKVPFLIMVRKVDGCVMETHVSQFVQISCHLVSEVTFLFRLTTKPLCTIPAEN